MKKNLKRAASFVVALGIALGSAATITAADFSDVPSDANYAEAVSGLSAIGILNGYEDGTFKPDSNITRAEVAAVVVRALAQESAAVSSKGATAFTDVPADHWASGYVNVASSGNNAFINGMGDGTFAPDANVTYAQVIKMLVSGIGYGDWGISYGGYPTGYITAAKNLGIIDGVSSVNADEAATRGTVAQLTFNAVNTPLLSLDKYTPTNPEYIILDGSDGRKYETVLTYYHNIYTVEGRVIETNRTTSGTLEVGQVSYQIENTKNYGEDAIIVKRADGDFVTEKMYTDKTDVDSYLNVYSKALVHVDENEDATIISIVTSGKNQIVELDTKGWDDEEYDNADGDFAEAIDAFLGNGYKPQTYFYSDASKKGKSTRYYFAEDDGECIADLYVNGVEMDLNDENLIKYVFNNDVGKVTLVDTPAEGSVSTDGKYDAIFVTYYGSAIVDSVSSDKIYFDEYERDVISTSSLKLELDDDDYEYTFILDGKEIKLEDLKEGDVLSIAFDPTAKTFQDSNFYSAIVSRKVVEGRVNEHNEEDGEIGIGDGTYGVVAGLSADGKKDDGSGDWDFGSLAPTLGSSYTAYVDAFDRIVKYEKLASNAKYGIVQNFFDDNGEWKLRIIDTTGSSKTLVVDEDKVDANTDGIRDILEEMKEKADDKGNKDNVPVDKDGNNIVNGTITDAYQIWDRVISYETNSSGEVRKVEKLNPTVKDGSYKKNSNKLAGLSIGESTVILAKDDSDKNDVNVVNKSSLIDDSDYVAIGYDKDGDDYPFVLIVRGIGDFNEDTRFAVVNKVAKGTNDDGDNCNKVTLYNSDSDEAVTLYTEEDDAKYLDLQKGDVIVYKLNASGEIKDFEVLFAQADVSDYNDFVSGNDWKTISDDAAEAIKDFWRYADGKDNDAGIVVGPVIDKSSNSVTIVSHDDINNSGLVDVTRVTDYSLDDDTAVYIYDLNNNKDDRLYKGKISSIIKESIPTSAYVDENGDRDKDKNTADLDIADAEKDFPIAFAKTMNGDEITDILVIIPRD